MDRLKRILGIPVAFALWLWAVVPRVVDWIGRTTLSDDWEQLTDERLPALLNWLFQTPWWVPAILATVLTVWLMVPWRSQKMNDRHSAKPVGSAQSLIIDAGHIRHSERNGHERGYLTLPSGARSEFVSFDCASAAFGLWEYALPPDWGNHRLRYRLAWSHPKAGTSHSVVFFIYDPVRHDRTFNTYVRLSDTGGATDTVLTSSWSEPSQKVDLTGDRMKVFQIERSVVDKDDILPVDARVHWIEIERV